MTTVDDLPAEGLPFIIERTLETGAKNVHVLTAMTKKGRMEYIVLVDVDEKFLDDVTSLLALEFGTLGIKAFQTEHIMLPFEILSKNVKVKAKNTILESKIQIKYLKNDKHRIINLKAEFEDIKNMALHLNSKGIKIPLSKLKTIIEAEAYKKLLQKEDIIIKVGSDEPNRLD
jgi:uncharacterized protein (DUF111 family)